MTKFTPGPWEITRGAQEHPFSIEGLTKTIALIKMQTEKENTEANAVLIRKAPEMYQLIIDLKYTLESMYNPDSDFAETADKYLDKAHNLLTEIDRE